MKDAEKKVEDKYRIVDDIADSFKDYACRAPALPFCLLSKEGLLVFRADKAPVLLIPMRIRLIPFVAFSRLWFYGNV